MTQITDRANFNALRKGLVLRFFLWLQALICFARGVIARLETWDTLCLAKRTWLASVIVDAFEETVPTPDDQYVKEILVQVLADEFDTDLEDGSAEPVALDIVRIWARDESRLAKPGSQRAAGQEVAHDDAEEWEDEDDEDSGMDDEEEAPQLMETRHEEAEVDEDGFSMVKGKGKSHR
ncbi:hypothetical protein B0H17DRAFT_1160882 [Mycena rosella]|uniref:Pre-rRNA-processing protein TSR2 n=1 Tax=Mycena rosella TaxID=1033263 RepID=A0AAD7GD46_MYCRO|nr:hypothetical protein B0H17DRAFT_1160882 [Mycena rosella]